jgi:hypothetical protein
VKPLFSTLWGAPVALGILTVIGLLSALLGDGMWDALSAITLGAPVAVGLRYWLWPRPQFKDR